MRRIGIVFALTVVAGMAWPTGKTIPPLALPFVLALIFAAAWWSTGPDEDEETQA